MKRKAKRKRMCGRRNPRSRKTPYNDLTIIPRLVAEAVAARPYTGSELRGGASNAVAIEAKRRNMTVWQVREFANKANALCRAAYESNAPWFMKIVKSRDNSGRNQLYVYMSHWLASYLSGGRISKSNPPSRKYHNPQCRTCGRQCGLLQMRVVNGTLRCRTCAEANKRLMRAGRRKLNPKDMTYTNFYYHCGTEWDDPNCDSMHNDHCPVCDAEVEPYKSKENETGKTISHMRAPRKRRRK